MAWEDILKTDEGAWNRIHDHLKAKFQEYKQDYPQANTISFNRYDEIYNDLKWALQQEGGENRLNSLGRQVGLQSFNAAHQGNNEVMAFYY